MCEVPAHIGQLQVAVLVHQEVVGFDVAGQAVREQSGKERSSRGLEE
jgi:hypothetical protein